MALHGGWQMQAMGRERLGTMAFGPKREKMDFGKNAGEQVFPFVA